MPKFTWLRSLGPIGTFIANAIVFLTTNWGLVVSAGLAIFTALVGGAYEIVSNPRVQVGVGTFVATLWTYIGILVLVDRRHPRLIRLQPDYRYGLTFEGLTVVIEPTSDEGYIQFGFPPRTTDMRRVFDACLYVVKTGCQWRQLPRDFPPWRTCYGYFVEWGSLVNKQGIFRRLHRRLYFQARKAAGRKPYPSVVIIDSQSVRTGKMGGVRGYDGGKHIKGRKRHTAVDTLGLPMAVTITAANVHDLHGGKRSLTRVSSFLGGRKLKKIYADGAYAAESFRLWVKKKFDALVQISKNLAQKFKAFVPVSQRWVIERSFSWWFDYRRLTIDYERTIKSSRSMLRLAAIRLILNRLAPNELATDW